MKYYFYSLLILVICFVDVTQSAHWTDIDYMHSQEYLGYLGQSFDVNPEDFDPAFSYFLNEDGQLEFNRKPSVTFKKFLTSVKKGDYEQVSNYLYFFACKFSINKFNPQGLTALMVAASKGYLDIVELLIENGADSTIKSNNVTALDVAFDHGHNNIVQFLFPFIDFTNFSTFFDKAIQVEIEPMKFLLELGQSLIIAKYTKDFRRKMELLVAQYKHYYKKNNDFLWSLFHYAREQEAFDVDKAQWLLRLLEYEGVIIPEAINRLMIENTPEDALFSIEMSNNQEL